MGSRILCYTDDEGRSGICTHHYSGEFIEGDCKTCSFPSIIEKLANLDTWGYARWREVK